MARRRITALVVVEDRVTRTLYVNALLAEGYMAHGAPSVDDVASEVATTRFDIVILDSELDPHGLAVAEWLARLQPRPRLVAITARPPDGAPLEFMFEAYLEKPCPTESLVEVVRSLPLPPARKPDLLIVSRDRVGIADVLERFGSSLGEIEIRLDSRRGDRRRPGGARGFRWSADRRHQDRRSFDVNAQLRMEGWAFVPAASRG